MTSIIYTLVKAGLETERTARIISDVFNPLLMPPLVMGVIAYSDSMPAGRIFLLLSIVLLFYSLLPLVFAIVLSRDMGEDSLDFILKPSRKVLYSLSVVSACVGVLLVYQYFPEYIVRLTAVIFLINLIAALFLNFRWKLSVHSAAISTAAVCLVLFGRFGTDLVYPTAAGLLLLFGILPLVSWSRYRLKVHSIPELLGGIVLGLVLTAATVICWYGF